MSLPSVPEYTLGETFVIALDGQSVILRCQAFTLSLALAEAEYLAGVLARVAAVLRARESSGD